MGSEMCIRDSPWTAVKSTMSEPDVKKQVASLARRLNGYKGRIRLDLTKLDHNFTTLRGNPASLTLLETVRRYFEHVDSSVQKARELYIETMGLIPTEEWDAEWARKSDELEADMEKAEKMMEKAERDHANAMKDLPVPAPGPVPSGGGAKALPKVDILSLIHI